MTELTTNQIKDFAKIPDAGLLIFTRPANAIEISKTVPLVQMMLKRDAMHNVQKYVTDYQPYAELHGKSEPCEVLVFALAIRNHKQFGQVLRQLKTAHFELYDIARPTPDGQIRLAITEDKLKSADDTITYGLSEADKSVITSIAGALNADPVEYLAEIRGRAHDKSK